MNPATELQKSTYADLVAADIPGVMTKVFHRVPANTALPYVEIGHDQVMGDDTAGVFFDCYVEVSVFAKTMPEMKAIADRVHTALDRAPTLEGFTCHEWHFTGLRSVTQKYGSDIIEQGVVEFEYSIQRLP